MKFFEAVTGKIDKIVIAFASVVLAISLYLVHALSQDYEKKETIASLDTMLLFTKNMLDEEQQRALSLSLLLSQDTELLRAYAADDRKRVFGIVKAKIDRLARLQGYRFDVQVHDAQLRTYLRSWDFSIRGEKLASFREGLVLVRQRRTPLVSIEVGKRLNIKAISPILKHGTFEGSIEVIEGFEHLRKRLEEQGYRLYILLDRKYLPVARSLRQAPRVGEGYVLVGSVEDPGRFEALKGAQLSGMGSFGYFTRRGHLFGYFDLRNYHNDRLGYLLIGSANRVTFSKRLHHETPTAENNHTGVIIR